MNTYKDFQDMISSPDVAVREKAALLIPGPLVFPDDERRQDKQMSLFEALAKDREVSVRAALATREDVFCYLNEDTRHSLAKDESEFVRGYVARNRGCLTADLELLAYDSSPLVRRGVAGNLFTPETARKGLTYDSDAAVKNTAKRIVVAEERYKEAWNVGGELFKEGHKITQEFGRESAAWKEWDVRFKAHQNELHKADMERWNCIDKETVIEMKNPMVYKVGYMQEGEPHTVYLNSRTEAEAKYGKGAWIQEVNPQKYERGPVKSQAQGAQIKVAQPAVVKKRGGLGL